MSMERKYSRYIEPSTLKVLLARSGNQCAFPECQHPIFNEDNSFIAQLCHIEGISPAGQRHNPDKTDEETNSYENLLFLCYRHHIETNDVSKYPVSKLLEIKNAHEAKFREDPYKYDDKILDELIKETTLFWQKVEELHENHIAPDLKVPIDTNKKILDLIDEINNDLAHLSEVNQILMKSIKNSNFEDVCLSFPNLLCRISIAVSQLEIKYMEELLLKNGKDEKIIKKLDEAREHFKRTAQYAGLG